MMLACICAHTKTFFSVTKNEQLIGTSRRDAYHIESSIMNSLVDCSNVGSRKLIHVR
jgi:hypothetical protein